MFQITNPELFHAALRRSQQNHSDTVERMRAYRKAQRRYRWIHMTYDHIGGHFR